MITPSAMVTENLKFPYSAKQDHENHHHGRRTDEVHLMTEPVGALIALKLTNTPFSVSSVLGLLVLMGVSVETAVIDVSYINISGTFYYLCSILDGYSRYIVNWDLRESMTEADIEIILERAKELHPEVKPRIISDNGPQFIAKDFKEFIRVSGMTHVRTSPYYPRSNGKIERWHKSLKGECIRPGTPLSLDDARRLVQGYVGHYNNVRLNSATGYITPKDMSARRQQEIHAERDRKLEVARRQRQVRRQNSA